MPGATSPMFGAPVGEEIARQQFMREQTSLAQMAQMAAQIRRADAETAKLTAEQEGQRLMQEAWQRRNSALANQAASPAPALKSPSSQFWEGANDAANAGLFDMAQKMASTASSIDSRMAAARASESNSVKSRLDIRLKGLKALQGTLREVTDQESFDLANEWFEETFQQTSPLKGYQYSPTVLKQLGQAVLTEEEKINLDLKRMDVNSKLQNRLDQIRDRGLRRNLEERRTAAYEERSRRLGKTAGDKPLQGATKQDITAATRLIMQDIYPDDEFDSLPTEVQKELATGAQTIADEAKKLQRANTGLTRTEAIAQAYAEGKRNGDWEHLKRSWYDPRKDALKYRGLGKSAKTPMPFPKDGSGLINKRYYQNAQGHIARYVNGKMQLVEAAELAEGEADLEGEEE